MKEEIKMDMENKEKIIQPLSEEEMKDVSGGFITVTFRCVDCGYEKDS